MTTEPPETGLVVRYSFLWPREHDRGEREGRKDRPVCFVVPVNVGQGAIRDGRDRAVIARDSISL